MIFVELDLPVNLIVNNSISCKLKMLIQNFKFQYIIICFEDRLEMQYFFKSYRTILILKN